MSIEMVNRLGELVNEIDDVTNLSFALYEAISQSDYSANSYAGALHTMFNLLHSHSRKAKALVIEAEKLVHSDKPPRERIVTIRIPKPDKGAPKA